MENIITQHATPNLTTTLAEYYDEGYIVTTINNAGFMLWYKKLDNLQAAWHEYDLQVANPSNPYAGA